MLPLHAQFCPCVQRTIAFSLNQCTGPGVAERVWASEAETQNWHCMYLTSPTLEEYSNMGANRYHFYLGWAYQLDVTQCQT